MKIKSIPYFLVVLAVTASGAAFGQSDLTVPAKPATSDMDQSMMLATIESQQQEIQSLKKQLLQLSDDRPQQRMTGGQSRNDMVKKQLFAAHEALEDDLVTLNGYFTKQSQLNEQLALRVKELSEQSVNCTENIQTRGDHSAKSTTPTLSAKERLAASRLEYLKLQQKMQQDTREFNLVSNIMKTKLDTARSTINNIR